MDHKWILNLYSTIINEISARSLSKLVTKFVIKNRGNTMIQLKGSTMGFLLIMLSFSIVGVSAFVYETAQQTVTQTIQVAATLTSQDSALGNIFEGDTILYTRVGGGGDVELASLDDIISITTVKTNIYMHLDSDLDALADYSTYSIVVNFDTVPGGSGQSGTAATLTTGAPDSSAITLDAAGDWTFDFEITTTANGVVADTPTTVTITVSVEDT